MIYTYERSSGASLLWGGFKVLIFVLFCWLINDRIIQYDYSKEIGEQFINRLLTRSNSFYFLIALFFVFLNWYLESIKWQKLCSDFYHISIYKASKSIFLGLSIGILTPGRLGEYGGRMLVFNNDQKALAVRSHFLSSLSQNIVNLTIGILGGCFFLVNYTSFSLVVIGSLSTIGLVFVCILLALYYNTGLWTKYILRYCPKSFLDYIKSLESHSNMDRRTLNNAILISLVRYIVFCTQYALLLYFFGLEIEISAIYAGITLIYFIQSGIPLPPFLSMLARGEIAIVVWSIFSASALSILSATFTLWIINLLIPALIGTLFLVRMKFINNDITTES